jgi:hypothetical protein
MPTDNTEFGIRITAQDQCNERDGILLRGECLAATRRKTPLARIISRPKNL